MLDMLKNSDITIHARNDYHVFFENNAYNNKLICGCFKFCIDKFICVKNNREDLNKKLKSFKNIKFRGANFSNADFTGAVLKISQFQSLVYDETTILPKTFLISLLILLKSTIFVIKNTLRAISKICSKKWKKQKIKIIHLSAEETYKFCSYNVYLSGIDDEKKTYIIYWQIKNEYHHDDITNLTELLKNGCIYDEDIPEEFIKKYRDDQVYKYYKEYLLQMRINLCDWSDYTVHDVQDGSDLKEFIIDFQKRDFPHVCKVFKPSWMI